MIRVTVKPFFYISDALGQRKEIQVSLNNEATIVDLLDLLRKLYNLPDEIRVDRYKLELFRGDETRSIMILKNGKDIKSLDGLKTKLEDGSEVAIFPLVAGG